MKKNKKKHNKVTNSGTSLINTLVKASLKRSQNKKIIEGQFQPFVSVICPTYNRREFLPYLLYIYQYQDYPADRRELILLDDSEHSNQDLITLLVGSASDETIRYIYSDKRLALGEKRNQLNVLATGEYIICMDDDDYYPPDKISYTITQMKNNYAQFSGSDQIYVWYSHLNKIYKTTSMGANHALNGTFAYHRNYLKKNRYLDKKILAEEAEFLRNFTVPVLQIEPRKAILCIAHNHNTFDKDFIISSNEASDFTLEDIVEDKNLLAYYHRLTQAPASLKVNWAFFEKIVIVTRNDDISHWQQLQKKFTDLGINAEQLVHYPLLQHPSHIVSQSKTHLAILQQAKDAAWRNYLLLEEDIEFVKKDRTLNHVNRLFTFLTSFPWEVILLGGQYGELQTLTVLPGVARVQIASAACAYAVNQPYYDILLEDMTKGITYQQQIASPADYSLNAYWLIPMQRDRWLGLYPSFAYQSKQWDEKKQVAIESAHLFFHKILQAKDLVTIK